MIPKTVHHVWVGTAPKPELVERCITSWKNHCRDYKIIEWGNAALERFDNIYLREAAAAGKWAFVSDYVRLAVLQEQGGIYVDTDLEITANIDRFLENDFFMGFERTLKRVRPMPALIGATPNNPILRALLDEYADLHFDNSGVQDTTSNTDRINRHFARAFGMTKAKYGDGETTIQLNETSVLYPHYYFCAPKPGHENFAIHHFDGSWVDRGKRKTLFRIGAWHLLKFRFKLGEDITLPLNDNEQLIWSISSNGKEKRRSFALVKRASN